MKMASHPNQPAAYNADLPGILKNMKPLLWFYKAAVHSALIKLVCLKR
jgi:hypothetical protein